MGASLNQQLDLELKTPDQVWVGDITSFEVAGFYRYLAGKCRDGQVQPAASWAWKLRTQKGREAPPLEALHRTVPWVARRPGAGLGVPHRSAASNNAAGAFKERIAELGFTQSMNRPGKVTDNASSNPSSTR